MPFKKTHILLAFMCVLVVFQVRNFYGELYQDTGQLTITQPEDAHNTVVFSWQGNIDLPMARHLQNAFDAWKDKVKTIIIDLNSPGGSLREGRDVIGLINAMKRTHQVNTYVGPQGICLSMCVPIFLQGKKRLAAASSKWMFHEPVKVDFFTDEEVDIPDFERRALAERFFERYFANSEIDPNWRRNLRLEWQDGKEVWRTGRQLVDEGSNIIHQVF